jgi:hypothetical protein
LAFKQHSGLTLAMDFSSRKSGNPLDEQNGKIQKK